MWAVPSGRPDVVNVARPPDTGELPSIGGTVVKRERAAAGGRRTGGDADRCGESLGLAEKDRGRVDRHAGARRVCADRHGHSWRQLQHLITAGIGNKQIACAVNRQPRGAVQVGTDCKLHTRRCDLQHLINQRLGNIKIPCGSTATSCSSPSPVTTVVIFPDSVTSKIVPTRDV